VSAQAAIKAFTGLDLTLRSGKTAKTSALIAVLYPWRRSIIAGSYLPVVLDNYCANVAGKAVWTKLGYFSLQHEICVPVWPLHSLAVVTITIKIVNSTEPVYITKQGVTQNETLVTPQQAISTQKHKYKVLRIASEIDFPKVRTFLESVARNSRNSNATYDTGLKHFQRFLAGSTSTSNYYQNCNVETIIPAIQAGASINVYELMDGLVSYFVVVRLSHEQQHIAPTSIFLYVDAVKSYLLYHDIDINPAKFRRKVRLPKIAREDEQPLDATRWTALDESRHTHSKSVNTFNADCRWTSKCESCISLLEDARIESNNDADNSAINAIDNKNKKGKRILSASES
jgi:hypothetical protein